MVTLVAIVVVLWAIDYATLGDRVARNVSVENVDLSRRSGNGLKTALTRADAAYGQGSVVFVIDGEDHPMSAAEIGLHLDEEATATAARQVGRNDPSLLKPVHWVASFFASRHAPVTVRLDRDRLAEALATLPGQTPVVEPRVIGSVETIGTTPGKPGYGFTPEDVAPRIERQARDGSLPLRIPLAAGIIEPTVTDGEVELLAAYARTLTDQRIRLSIPGATMVATPPLLRSWITSKVSPATGQAMLSMDPDAVVPTLRDELGTRVSDPVDATFTVVDSEAYLVPQVDGRDCCAESSGAEILEALEAQADRDSTGEQDRSEVDSPAGDDPAGEPDETPGDDSSEDMATVDLPLVDRPPEFTTAKARELGITTRLGTGTDPDPQRVWSPDMDRPDHDDGDDGQEAGDGDETDDAPADTGTPGSTTTSTSTTTTTTIPADPAAEGQFIVPIPNRRGQVDNIDQAIPRLNGRIIRPGRELSLNEVIGAPSPERGFVPADVQTADGPTWVSGGGTDLVAAALFEAAYTTGLDIPTSARHHVLPAGVTPGIEATLGWTEPDLVVANPSDHAVLIWVDRIDAGIRVQLFGTPFVRSVDTSDREKRFGPGDACLSVHVKRTREFLDDTEEAVDRFDARYTPPPAARDDPDRVRCPDED